MTVDRYTNELYMAYFFSLNKNKIKIGRIIDTELIIAIKNLLSILKLKPEYSNNFELNKYPIGKNERSVQGKIDNLKHVSSLAESNPQA